MGRLFDPTPRICPSAIALLSFTLLLDTPSLSHAQLLPVAEWLEDRLVSSTPLPSLDIAAASAAILATKQSLVKAKTLARMKTIAGSSRQGLRESGVYFYDYEYSSDMHGPISFGRDYFIVPTEILLGIAGFQASAPSALRLRAEAVLSDLVAHLRQEKAYRSGVGRRLSSLDQAWCAIFLKLAALDYKPARALAKIRYGLSRSRKENWLTKTGLPVFSMVYVVAMNVLGKDAGRFANVLLALGGLFIGGLYGPTIVRRLFPGRE